MLVVSMAKPLHPDFLLKPPLASNTPDTQPGDLLTKLAEQVAYGARVLI